MSQKSNNSRRPVKVLPDGLAFPNGVALSQNGNFILLSETSRCRILRFWLQTSKTGTVEVFAQLPGFPDNIKRNGNGEFWVGKHSRREKLLEWLLSNPWIGRTLLKIPFPQVKALISFFSKRRKNAGLAARLSEEGEILEMHVRAQPCPEACPNLQKRHRRRQPV